MITAILDVFSCYCTCITNLSTGICHLPNGTQCIAEEDINAEGKEIQSTVTEAAQQNEKVDEGFLSRRFRNIASMAPDVLDVLVATLANPLSELGVAVRKLRRR